MVFRLVIVYFKKSEIQGNSTHATSSVQRIVFTLLNQLFLK